MTLDPAAVERFRHDVEVLAGAAPAPERKLGVAVSGGADSLALLLLAHAAYPGAVIAATVDHGLRPEAPAEAAFVAQVCGDLGVSHESLAGTVAPGNLQDAARDLRYRLLGDWAVANHAAALATAHQQDDVAETFLMRARRGAGLGGLAAMAPVRPLFSPNLLPGEGRGPAAARLPKRAPDSAAVPKLGPGLRRGADKSPLLLIRPLLAWPRAELAAIVTAAGIAPVADPSNADPRFDRARIRALLAGSGELPVERLAAAARNLRDAEEALQWIAAREWDARAAVRSDAIDLEAAGLPRELRRRLVERAVSALRAARGLEGAWREDGLDRLIATLDAGGTGTIAEVLVRPKAAIWHFMLAPPRRSH